MSRRHDEELISMQTPLFTPKTVGIVGLATTPTRRPSHYQGSNSKVSTPTATPGYQRSEKQQHRQAVFVSGLTQDDTEVGVTGNKHHGGISGAIATRFAHDAVGGTPPPVDRNLVLGDTVSDSSMPLQGCPKPFAASRNPKSVFNFASRSDAENCDSVAKVIGRPKRNAATTSVHRRGGKSVMVAKGVTVQSKGVRRGGNSTHREVIIMLLDWATMVLSGATVYFLL